MGRTTRRRKLGFVSCLTLLSACLIQHGCGTISSNGDDGGGGEDAGSAAFTLESGTYLLTLDTIEKNTCGTTAYQVGDTVEITISVSGGMITLNVGNNSIEGLITGNSFVAALDGGYDWNVEPPAAQQRDCIEDVFHSFTGLTTADNTFSLTYEIEHRDLVGPDCMGIYLQVPCTERRAWTAVRTGP